VICSVLTISVTQEYKKSLKATDFIPFCALSEAKGMGINMRFFGIALFFLIGLVASAILYGGNVKLSDGILFAILAAIIFNKK